MDAPYRRIITGHDPTGKSIITSDSTLSPLSLYDPSQTPTGFDPGYYFLFRSEGSPTNNDVPFTELHGAPLPLVDPAGGTTVRVINMPPGSSAPMHRTVSLDFGVVLSGEVVMELDGGVEEKVGEMSTVVQRGTCHAWHNRGERVCRILFVMMPAEKVKVKETGEELGQVGIPEDGLAA